MKTISLFLLALISCVSCSDTTTRDAARPETLVESYSDTEMDKAIAKAKSSVDEFIAVLSEKNADSFSVKAPITDSNGTEHFWISDVLYKNGVFNGSIGNEPGIVENVKFGQSWKVKKEDISDWMYIRGEMIHGGYTIDPLLGSYPKKEAEALRAKLVR